MSSRISIHALLAESDQPRKTEVPGLSISIHALLAESDGGSGVGSWPRAIFLSTLSLRRATPGEHHASSQQEFLSTLSLRRATNTADKEARKRLISIHALLAESDHSAHPETRQRGAISIHALLAESDRVYVTYNQYNNTFLSTLSLRRATETLR